MSDKFFIVWIIIMMIIAPLTNFFLKKTLMEGPDEPESKKDFSQQELHHEKKIDFDNEKILKQERAPLCKNLEESKSFKTVKSRKQDSVKLRLKKGILFSEIFNKRYKF